MQGFRKWLRSKIVSAAPTCTLWVQDYQRDILKFRFVDGWYITSIEYREAVQKNSRVRALACPDN